MLNIVKKKIQNFINMSDFLEILKYTLPALIVLLTAYLMLKKLTENEQSRARTENAIETQRITLPVRLQAYERITLLLERISPESMIMRLSSREMTARKLQSAMLSTIRAEFDHNISQQIYISTKAWGIVKSARENLIRIINTTAENIKPDAPAIELSKAILENLMELDKSPTVIAIDFLKQEAGQLL